MKTVTALVLALAVLCAACGGDDDDSGSGDTAAAETQASGSGESSEDTASGDSEGAASEIEVDVEDFIEDPEGAAQDLAESIEEVQEARGGGSATLVVGDDTWTFESVLCAFGEDEIGQEGAEFVLSSIQDGLQMYASIDSFGHSVSLNDIQDFENPSVDLTAFGDDFIELDGTSVRADTEFIDGTSESFEGVAGTFEATCP